MKDKKNYVRYDLVKRYKDLNSIIKMYKTQLSNLQSEDSFHTFNQNSMFIGNFYSIIKKIINIREINSLQQKIIESEENLKDFLSLNKSHIDSIIKIIGEENNSNTDVKTLGEIESNEQSDFDSF